MRGSNSGLIYVIIVTRVNLIRNDGFMRNDMIIARKYKDRWLGLCLIITLCISLTITGKCLKILKSEIQVQNLLTKEFDYDKFRDIRIDKKQLARIKDEANTLLRKNPNLKGHPYIDEIGYLTYSMMVSDFDMINGSVPDMKSFIRGIGRVSKTDTYSCLYGYYKAILSDLMYFPVPIINEGTQRVSYDDSWYAPRSYGGNRRHEGTDLMAGNNIPGYFPIISITDGCVEKIGWLDQGGNRIGIRSESGAYFYYAHLDSYAPDLKEGDAVIAGQVLGFMGDTGYGEEGTKGMFDVHLHLGIYVNSGDQEISVNPYWILKMLEYSRIKLIY